MIRLNEKLFTNLKNISKIRVNEKFFIDNEQFFIIQKNSILNSLTRYLLDYNRTKNLTQLSEMYSNIFNFIDNQLQSKFLKFNTNYSPLELETHNSIKKNLLDISNELDNSIFGLKNLKQTYNNDILIESKIENLIECIYEYIDKINTFGKEHSKGNLKKKEN